MHKIFMLLAEIIQSDIYHIPSSYITFLQEERDMDRDHLNRLRYMGATPLLKMLNIHGAAKARC